MKKRKFFHIDVTNESMARLRKGAKRRGVSAVATWIKWLIHNDIKAEVRRGDIYGEGKEGMRGVWEHDRGE